MRGLQFQWDSVIKEVAIILPCIYFTPSFYIYFIPWKYKAFIDSRASKELMIEKCENKVPFESVSCLYRRQEGDVFYLFQCRCQEKEVNIKDNVVNLESMRWSCVLSEHWFLWQYVLRAKSLHQINQPNLIEIRVNKPTAAKKFISTTVLLETFIFATFYHCPYVYSKG